MAANRKASAQSRKSQKPAANRPVSFEQAALLCPTQGQAERVAERFGLAVPDYQAIRELHARALHDMAGGLAGALNDKATQMHFQRIVGSLVSSAVGAGRFYSEKVSEARAAAARAADGGEEPGAPVGFEFESPPGRGIRCRHGDAGFRPPRRRPRRCRGLQGDHRRRLGRLPGSRRCARRPPAALAQDPALGFRRQLSHPRRGPSGPLPSPPPSPQENAEMSITFVVLRRSGQRYDRAPLTADDSELSLSNENADDVLDALEIEDPYSSSPWPIAPFRARLAATRRKRLGHQSPAIATMSAANQAA